MIRLVEVSKYYETRFGSTKVFDGVNLALLVGAAAFNLFYSLLAGCVLFSVLYGFALWSTTHDPQMLQILLRAGANRTRYDAAKREAVVASRGAARW